MGGLNPHTRSIVLSPDPIHHSLGFLHRPLGFPSMATARIAASIKSIPAKKAELRKAFDLLQSTSSSLASFTLQWSDLESHFSALEQSIEARFIELQAKEAKKPSSAAAKAAKPAEAAPRPELVAFCVKNDGKGLRSFLTDNRKDDDLRTEVTAALRTAADPAALVLDAMVDFYPAKAVPRKDGPVHGIRTACVDLLERVQLIGPELSPVVRERAKKLAVEWKGKVSKGGGDNGLEVMGFLQLLASYGLAADYGTEELLEVLTVISRRKQVPELIKNLGLTDKLPDLIQKLSNKGKRLDAVKIISAFNLFDKFPPVPLLKAYIKEIKNVAQEVRKKGNNSIQSENEATSKELGALKSVLKAIEDYKLEAEYPSKNVQEQISRLERKMEQQKARKKRLVASTEQANKRPRPATDGPLPAFAVQSRPPLVQAQAPNMGMTRTGPYDLPATGSLYSQMGLSFNSTTPLGLSGNRSPLRNYPYSSESFAGNSGLYNRASVYSGHSASSLPNSYGPSFYP